MADTTKIKKLIYALSMNLGLEKPDWNELNKMSYEELMKKADELRAKEQEVEGFVAKSPNGTRVAVDGSTLGMVFKLAYKTSNHNSIFQEPDKFKERVQKLYSMAKECEEYIGVNGNSPQSNKVIK